jgi:hypothetical protein
MRGGPTTVAPPLSGLWRVARGDNPLSVPPASLGGGVNRFDALVSQYGVLYFGSSLEVCFGEVLARFRPSLPMLALVEDEWAELDFMAVGAVPSDWRQRRSAVNVRVPSSARFVDIESVETHQFLRRELAAELAALGVVDLDVATVRSSDRRVTQLISEWVYENGDGLGGEVAGIRYESRIRSGWECWALFDDEDIPCEVVVTKPITADMDELLSVATLFDLQVF